MNPHTPHRIGLGLVCGVMLASLAAAPDPASARSGVTKARSCLGSNATPRHEALGRTRQAVLCLVNAERAARKLAPLAIDSRLQTAAERHSQDMGARDYFNHVTPSGIGFAERVRAAGFRNSGANLAENIAWGSGSLAQPAQVVKGWMASRPHRATILDPAMRRVGIGVALDAPHPHVSGAATYTANFVGASSLRASSRPSRARPRAQRRS